MRKRLMFLYILLVSLSAQVWALDASVTFARFYPNTGSYVEVYINIIKSTLVIDEGSNGAEILITFTKDDKIEVFNKYKLKIPRGDVHKDANLIDLQRFGLKAGTYSLKVEMVDMNDATKTLAYSDTVEIVEHDRMLSDIQLTSTITADQEGSKLAKNGIRMEPLAYNYLPENQSILAFYVEIYNADTKINDDFLLQYSLVTHEDGDRKPTVVVESYKRIKPESITPLLLKMDVSQVKSANYDLIVEIKNRDKILIEKISTHIIRANAKADYMVTETSKSGLENSFVQLLKSEKLNYHLKAINPVIPVNLKEMLTNTIKSDDDDAKRFFLYKYWSDQYGDAAKIAFEKYGEVARVVDQSFNSGFGYGFETDRGYIYLKYGQPDDVVAVEDEPSAPPYEIWVYNNIPQFNQTNVKFLYYNPSLATNDFILLHSTCRGERFNPAWEVELYRDATSEQGGVTVDTKNVSDNLNRNAKRFFNDF